MSLRRRVSVACVALAPIVAASTPPALASPPAVNEELHRRAAESFHDAQSAFARREFAAAAASFEQAAEYEPHPAALVNAAEAWELAGDLARAASACDGVLAVVDAAPNFQADARQRLARLEPRIAALDLRGPASWSVRLDAQTQAFVLPVKRRLLPGRHTVAFVDVLTGEVRTVDLLLVAGETRFVPLPLALARPTLGAPGDRPGPSVSSASRRNEPPLPSWIAFGGGAVGAGIGIVFGLQTLTARHEFEANPTHATLDAFYRDRAIANIGWGTAVASALAGALIWWTSATRGSPGRSASRW